eukprot:1148054-Pelagomonas_calceolata.AAC.1
MKGKGYIAVPAYKGSLAEANKVAGFQTWNIPSYYRREPGKELLKTWLVVSNAPDCPERKGKGYIALPAYEGSLPEA